MASSSSTSATQPDGTLASDITPDFLHLSEKGYAIWAPAVEPKLAQLQCDEPIK